MRLDKFTENAQEAPQDAAELARARGQKAVEPEHLLLALVGQDEGVARTLLEGAGVSVQALQPALVSADQLAMMLLEGKFVEGDTIEVDVKDGELAFSKAKVAVPEA